MKLSKITLTLIASGLFSFAKAVENMASEADDAPSTAAVAGKSETSQQTDKKESKADTDPVEDDSSEEVEETEAQKKSRVRKERRLAKKKADAAKAAEEEEEEEDDSFLDDGDEAKVTKDDVKKALVALAKAEGNPAAKEILTKYKAANISQVKEADYESMMADIKAAQE